MIGDAIAVEIVPGIAFAWIESLAAITFADRSTSTLEIAGAITEAIHVVVHFVDDLRRRRATILAR